jgi:hypothetical protein
VVVAALLYAGFGRPVLVAQQRIGFAGRRFTAYLFRTSPNDGVRNLTGGPLLSSLRASGLDRLPLLISILRGDMSFVGPRPLKVGHPGFYCPDYFATRPGLFGMRQVDRSGNLGARRRAAHDRYYVRQWSIWLDLAVLARSFAELPPAENRTRFSVSRRSSQRDALDHAHGPVALQDIYLGVGSAATGSCLPWIAVGKWPNQRVQDNGRH